MTALPPDGEEQVDDDVMALREITKAGDLHPFSPAHQRHRRRIVEARLLAARSWIDAALRGDISLEDAVVAAHSELVVALREVCRKSLDAAT